MRKTMTVAVVLLTTLGVVNPLAGGDRHELTPGFLYRVTAPSLSPSPLIGTLVEANGREMILVGPGSGKRTVPLDAVTKLEWSAGRRSRVVEFALGGALLGAGVGAVGGATSGGECSTNKGGCAGMAALISGVGWSAVGAVVGLAVKTYGWKGVPVPRSQVTVVPMVLPGSRAGVSVAIRW